MERIKVPGPVEENPDGSVSISVIEAAMMSREYKEPFIRGIHCASLSRFIEMARGQGVEDHQILDEIVQFSNMTEISYFDGSGKRFDVLIEGEIRL